MVTRVSHLLPSLMVKNSIAGGHLAKLRARVYFDSLFTYSPVLFAPPGILVTSYWYAGQTETLIGCQRHVTSRAVFISAGDA